MFDFLKKKKIESTEELEVEKEELKKATDDFIDALKELKKQEDTSKNVLEEIVDFEMEFYELVAGTKHMKLLPVPDDKGNFPSEKDWEEVKRLRDTEKYTIVYQIRHIDKNGQLSETAILVGPNMTGIIYPTDELGYHA